MFPSSACLSLPKNAGDRKIPLANRCSTVCQNLCLIELEACVRHILGRGLSILDQDRKMRAGASPISWSRSMVSILDSEMPVMSRAPRWNVR
jgi:hypothetical protein